MKEKEEEELNGIDREKPIRIGYARTKRDLKEGTISIDDDYHLRFAFF